MRRSRSIIARAATTANTLTEDETRSLEQRVAAAVPCGRSGTGPAVTLLPGGWLLMDKRWENISTLSPLHMAGYRTPTTRATLQLRLVYWRLLCPPGLPYEQGSSVVA